MPVVPMQKVAILGHEQIRDEILKYLQKHGILEITPIPAEEQKQEEEKELELALAEIESALRLLESASGKKKNLIESFAPYKETVEEEVLEQTAREFNWRAVVSRLKDYENQLANQKNLEHSLRAELALISPWQNLKAKLNQLSCTQKTCVAAGICKPRELEALEKKLGKFEENIK